MFGTITLHQWYISHTCMTYTGPLGSRWWPHLSPPPPSPPMRTKCLVATPERHTVSVAHCTTAGGRASVVGCPPTRVLWVQRSQRAGHGLPALLTRRTPGPIYTTSPHTHCPPLGKTFRISCSRKTDVNRTVAINGYLTSKLLKTGRCTHCWTCRAQMTRLKAATLEIYTSWLQHFVRFNPHLQQKC